GNDPPQAYSRNRGHGITGPSMVPMAAPAIWRPEISIAASDCLIGENMWGSDNGCLMIEYPAWVAGLCLIHIDIHIDG
ncbi:hypothetical protein, partial [Hoeflea sp.]|uniref:hypothetical protein n=1 Tax=Hoeflea sp. TaxID=1940281 RepID=UPI002AFEBADD